MVTILARLSAALAGADLALDDAGPRTVDDTGLEEREQREDRGRRVATGAGDPFRGLQVVAVKLRDAVHESVEAVGPRVGRAVPAVVVRRIAKAMVARKIDQHRRAIFELMGTVRSVREREEQHVALSDVLVVDERQARALAEVRVSRADRLARQGLTSGRDLPHLRMTEQQTQELTAGVARGSYHARFHVAALATSST